jgi:hypothetical protein
LTAADFGFPNGDPYRRRFLDCLGQLVYVFLSVHRVAKSVALQLIVSISRVQLMQGVGRRRPFVLKVSGNKSDAVPSDRLQKSNKFALYRKIFFDLTKNGVGPP